MLKLGTKKGIGTGSTGGDIMTIEISLSNSTCSTFGAVYFLF